MPGQVMMQAPAGQMMDGTQQEQPHDPTDITKMWDMNNMPK